MRVGVYVAATLVACYGVLAVAQTKVSTPQEFDKAMKPAQAAMRGVYGFFASGAYADARKELAKVKSAVADTQTFWILHQKPEAVRLNKDALAKIEAFEKLIAKEPVDVGSALGALKEIDPACRACHQQYRALEPGGNYSIKPGTIGG